MRTLPTLLLSYIALAACSGIYAQIPKPDDAPRPLSSSETQARFKLPPGFRMELVASEPLIREPSGVCWDEHGRLFVCELHGYNLEGQYDIEELNKTGKLDRVVQRIQADERHKKAADAETFGTIKLLVDDNHDGRMDRAIVWADRLPPCLGICAARGGLIAACKTQILFLQDRDRDDNAEIREVLFEGFQPGPLERSINCPQYGPDNWIYFGRGAGGGTITGKHLATPVQLPNTDFRIRADGSAIEPIVGSTGTMGYAFTESEDRFVISTNTPGNFVAPIEWHYLARNPNAATPSLQSNASSDQRVYPTSQPHPWRTRRADDPGFSKLYTDRYGIAESAPNGYFTSACSPLVYQDEALPGLRGQLLACEPAQNFVHRAIVQRDGARLNLSRDASETQSEFLSCSDPWFHAIALSHAPDGSVFVIDFYREIIEDYSAIPRYLQQEYGLIAGRDHGRVWRLTHDNLKASSPPDMSQLSLEQLAAEVVSSHLFQRTTARRLIVEQQLSQCVPQLRSLLIPQAEAFAILNVLHTLDGLSALQNAQVLFGLQHSDPSVIRASLKLAERMLDSDPRVLEHVLKLRAHTEPMVRLQLALSLGEVTNSDATRALVQLCREHANEPWMSTAILSSVPGLKAVHLLDALLKEPEKLAQADGILETLCTTIASRRSAAEMSETIDILSSCSAEEVQVRCLRGLASGFKATHPLDISESARQAIHRWLTGPNADIKNQALKLYRWMQLETATERQARLDTAFQKLLNVQLDSEAHLNALAQISDEDDASVTRFLLEMVSASTPRVREAIIDAIFRRKERIVPLLDAMEKQSVPVSMLSAVQRATLLESKDSSVRERATTLLNKNLSGPGQEIFQRYANALKQNRDPKHGQQVFVERCASCHQAHGVGVAVGPDLNAEFQRAEETIIKDFLAPSETISAGYVTYAVSTSAGQIVTGMLASETPTSLSLLQAGGKFDVVLRKDVDELKAMSVSLMPDDLSKLVSPQDLADLLAWLRRPPTQMILVDENPTFVRSLKEGAGTAEFIDTDSANGRMSLRITPPQRHAPSIKGWDYRIREKPQAGEFRYLRFAWKANEGTGVMLELAASGRWPPANRPERRYHAGTNTTTWQSVEVSKQAPKDWSLVTRDLWKDFGDFNLTGIAPTAMGGAVLFDRIELLQELPAESSELSLSHPGTTKPFRHDFVRQIIGHRGASAERPENTLASIQYAIDVGATAVEIDVRTSQDGVLILMHDESVDSTTDGHGKVNALNSDQIRALDAGAKFKGDSRFKGVRVPTLAEALELCRGKVDVLLDLKEQGAAYDQAVMKEVRQHGEPNRTIFGTRSVEQTKRFHDGMPAARILGLIGKQEDIEAYVAQGAQTIRLWPHWLSDEQLVPRVRKAGGLLHLGATKGDAAEVLPLLKHRPDSMSADSPSTLMETLTELSNRPNESSR